MQAPVHPRRDPPGPNHPAKAQGCIDCLVIADTGRLGAAAKRWRTGHDGVAYAVSAMRRAGSFAGLLLALLAAGCASAPPEGAATDRAVYEAFFAKAGGTRDKPTAVVGATDAAWFAANPFNATDWCAPHLAALGGVPIGLVEALYRVNETAAPIAADPPLANVALLRGDHDPPPPSDAVMRCLFEKEWAEPGTETGKDCGFQAYYKISRVAFSGDRRQALLKYLHRCLPLCGSEGFVAYQWDGRKWREIGRRFLWIS